MKDFSWSDLHRTQFIDLQRELKNLPVKPDWNTGVCSDLGIFQACN
jgi:hypothetical protein